MEHKTERQFFLDEAEKLLLLAKHCTDEEVRNYLRIMAGEWTERGIFGKDAIKVHLHSMQGRLH